MWLIEKIFNLFRKKYAVGQVWEYKTRVGEEKSLITFIKYILFLV